MYLVAANKQTKLFSSHLLNHRIELKSIKMSLPKDLFSQFQDYLNKEQETREVSILLYE